MKCKKSCFSVILHVMLILYNEVDFNQPTWPCAIFVKMFSILYINQETACKFNKIDRAQTYQFIFDEFNLSNFTYFEVLEDWRKTMITFIEHYF